MSGGSRTSGKAPDAVKYTATAASGALVGGVFPLFLFDKFGITKLLSSNSSATAAVYAFTAFAMVAFLILGIGAFFAKKDLPSIRKNILFNLVVFTFVGAFAVGFVYFVVTAYMRPTVNLSISYDRYGEDVAQFRDVSLSPYILHPERMPFVEKGNTVPITDGTSLVFGVDALHDLEKSYGETRSQLADLLLKYRFDNTTMGRICAEPQYAATITCMNWGHEGAMK
jgi:hypothetical protein